MNQTPSEQAERKTIILISLMTFLAYLGWSTIRPYVPLFAREEINATLPEVGIVGAATSIAGAALAIPFGLASIYMGRGKLAVIGSFAWGASVVIMSSSNTIASLIAIYALSGVGFALFDTSIAALTGDVSSPSRMARSFSYFTMAITAALAAGPALGGFIVVAVGFRGTILVGGLLTISASIIGILLMLTRGSADSPQPMDTQTVGAELRGNTVLLVGIILIFASFYPLSGLHSFVPLYGRFIGLDSLTIGLVFTAQFTSTTIARLTFGGRMDNSKAMRGYALGTALVISLTVSLIAVIPNLVYLIPMVALAGIGFGVINILSSVLVAQSTSAKARGLATGIGSSMRYLAFSLGPLAFAQSLTGLGESQSGYMLSFAFLALPTMAAMVLLLVAGSLMSKKTPAQNAVV